VIFILLFYITVEENRHILHLVALSANSLVRNSIVLYIV
jgi:hypothetical protein